MKRLLAGLVTVALMALLLWSGSRNPRPELGSARLSGEPAEPSGTPEARVRALLAGASAGDVAAYLAAFAPKLRARLEREADEKGRAAFSQSLRDAAGARKSHAVFAPDADGPDASTVVVESVYPDRNERQTYRLERVDGEWRVADVETIRAHRPPAKFGAPASYREPEGPPVPVQVPADEEESPME